MAPPAVAPGVSNEQNEPPPDTAIVHGEDAGTRIRAALRRTEPSAQMAQFLRLDDDAGRLEQARHQLVGGVEELTGLRLGQLQTLVAVADGADHHREVARATGQADDAAAVTVDGLVDRGLLARHHHPAEPNPHATPTLVHLTPRGEAVLGQSEAIRIRLLDAVAHSLAPDELRQVRIASETLRVKVDDGRRLIGGAPAAS